MRRSENFPAVLPGLVEPEQCSFLRRLATERVSSQRSYQGLIDTAKRDASFVTLHCVELTRIAPQLETRICSHLHRGSLVRPYSCMLYRYNTGAGFVSHHDAVTWIERWRGRTNGQPVISGDYTIVCMLSERTEYSGGELFFPGRGGAIDLGLGDAAIFPATRRYPHGVSPITSGTRLTLMLRPQLSRRSR